MAERQAHELAAQRYQGSTGWEYAQQQGGYAAEYNYDGGAPWGSRGHGVYEEYSQVYAGGPQGGYAQQYYQGPQGGYVQEEYYPPQQQQGGYVQEGYYQQQPQQGYYGGGSYS